MEQQQQYWKAEIKGLEDLTFQNMIFLYYFRRRLFLSQRPWDPNMIELHFPSNTNAIFSL